MSSSIQKVDQNIFSAGGNLLNLTVRNAWLSVDGLKSMPKLITLTLEFIRLDDEHLDMVNQCFPSLEVLNLIGVGGLKEPKIRLLQLKVCHWTVSNYPLLLAIHAPNLTQLKLHCVDPKTLVVETPLLSHLDLKIRKPGNIVNAAKLSNLKYVSLESSYLCTLAKLLCNKSVEKLELDVPQGIESDELSETFTVMDLVTAFPNIHDLTLGPGAWLKLEKSFGCQGVGPSCKWRKLKKLMIHLPLYYDFTFISFMLNLCVPFSTVILLIHGDVPIAGQNHIISRCKSNFPKIIWKWGMWRKSREISWICEGDWPFSF